jgi:hypothetical protein
MRKRKLQSQGKMKEEPFIETHEIYRKHIHQNAQYLIKYINLSFKNFLKKTKIEQNKK